jgi:two-component system CheB/CheR fusion protein
LELRSAISQVNKIKKKVLMSGIELKLNGTVHNIKIEVLPLKSEWSEPVLLILLSEQQQPKGGPLLNSTSKDSDSKSSPGKDRRIRYLKSNSN